MTIERLKIKGFKSFGSNYEFDFAGRTGKTGQTGKKSAGGFTAIVGPNGSGKSNILDALRYVLGESSSLKLRITRLSDLLFQGSASMPPSKEAEVSLILIPGESGAAETAEGGAAKAKITPAGARLNIKRRYETDSGSMYYIDGSHVRLQDVEEVKQRVNLSGDQFAFIGQGDVAEVIHQRPMQRRTHLEVLFGIDRYRKRRDDTANRLSLAETEMQRIQTLIQELSARRGEISRDVAVAIEARNILDDLENLRRDYYFSKRKALETRASDLEVTCAICRDQEDILRDWLGMWGKLSSDMERRQGVIAEREQGLLSEEKRLTERKDSLLRSCFQTAGNVRLLNERGSSARGELGQTEEVRNKTEQDLARAAAEKAKLESGLSGQRRELDALLRKMESGREEIQRARLERQSVRDGIARGELQRSQLESRKKALLESDSGRESEPLIREKETLENGIKAAAKEVASLEESETKTSGAFAEAFAEARKYAAASSQSRREISELEAQVEHLKEASEAEYPPPERMLLSASRLNKIAAKIEIVTEVFSCEPRAASAIEVFLGRRRFYLLVNSMSEAQEGINHLKSRGGGRATFLPLERARPRFADARFEGSHLRDRRGIVGWAPDLITVKSPWEPVLRHLLGDLLIIEDYELGAELVRKGASFPIVTIAGDIFSPAGTVSGGSVRQAQGSQRGKLQKLEDELSSQRARLAEVQREMARYDSLERKLQEDKTRISAALLSAREGLQDSERRLLTVNSALARLETEHSSSLNEINTITAELAALGGELAALSERLAGFGEIPDDEGESPALRRIQAEISLLEEKLRSSNELTGRIEREMEASEKKIAQLSSELDDMKEQKSGEHAKLRALGAEYFGVWQNLRAVQGRISESGSEGKKFILRARKAAARTDAAEARLRLNGEQIASAEEKMRSARSEIAQLNELWEEKYPYDRALADRIEAEKDLTQTMRKMERELKALGPYNLGALSEDESLLERTDFLTEQLEDARTARDELTLLIEETDKQVETLFMTALKNIDKRFGELFVRLFGGGEARLQVQDGENIWERGVEIYARPPGKQLHNITQLSGGEQSLTAIAHLFASLEVAGVPLAVLDEVDAALDEYNLIRFANLAKDYSRTIQLLVMTHRRTTMEQADIIYGVTMVEPGLSRIVGINIDDYS